MYFVIDIKARMLNNSLNSSNALRFDYVDYFRSKEGEHAPFTYLYVNAQSKICLHLDTEEAPCELEGRPQRPLLSPNGGPGH